MSKENNLLLLDLSNIYIYIYIIKISQNFKYSKIILFCIVEENK